MGNCICKIHNDIRDFFENARFDFESKEWGESKLGSYGMMEMRQYREGSSFSGKQEEVYQKYAKHKVQKESSLVNDVLGEFKSIDFNEVKWVFSQRLTEGDSVDVNRYLDGQERCWNGVRRKHKQKKVVRIYSEFGGHCGRSEKELAISGAMAVTLCEILESMGIGVELWACTYTKDVGEKGTDILEMIKVKSSEEFADLGMINYVTGNDKVFRNTGFSNWIRTLAENGDEASHGLGFHGNITMELLEGRHESECDGTVLIPSTYDVESAKRWLIDLLKKQDIIQKKGDEQ